MTPQQLAELAELEAKKQPKLSDLDEYAFDNRSVNQIAFDNYALGFIKGYEANQSLKYAKVFRICSHCNTEFELTFATTSNEKVTSFQNCTHCGKRNDTWISIRLKP